MTAYYNEIDPYCADWLRNLIKEGHIADGDVDTRSIEDVLPSDLAAYTQCHFFAGIGVWSYALRLAGWPDERPVWTGSCPCQPFSAAGKGAGFDDERHLWPAWHHLIREQRPGVVFGEQVASRDGLGWRDLVQADLEGAQYASAAIDLCAAGVGAPHIRQRLYFVAESESLRPIWWHASASTPLGRERSRTRTQRRCDARELADASSQRRQQVGGSAPRDEGADGGQSNGDHFFAGDGADGILAHAHAHAPGRSEQRSAGLQRSELHDAHGCGAASVMGDAIAAGLPQRGGHSRVPGGESGAIEGQAAERASLHVGFWSDAEWIACRDGKARPVEPGTFPLAHGITNRVGRLRAYGNAINAEAARTFVEAYLAGCSL